MVTHKNITFYNAVPMPHSVLLQSKLEKEGYEVYFWYYKNLTKLYPWSTLKSESPYHVYEGKLSDFRRLLSNVLKSDLVIITGWHTKIHIFLLFFCKLFRIETAYWLDVPEQPLKKGLSYQVKKFLLRSPDYLFITGKTGIENYKKWYRLDKAKFYDFPYLSAEFDERDVAMFNEKRKAAIASGDKIRLFISNRFIQRKGYTVLYKAFETLYKKGKLDRFQINVTGTGSEFETYKTQFAKLYADMQFLGWVSYEEYGNQMQRTDVYIHASLHEPFGIPPCDAMNCGKLLIASDAVYSSVDRVENGVNGYIYKANDDQQLAQILENLLDNPAQIYQMGNHAKVTAKEYGAAYNTNLIKQVLGS